LTQSFLCTGVTRLGRIAIALVVFGTIAVASAAKADNPKINIIIANRGTFVVELLPKAAPKTVAHILKLVNKKFYDGIKIHRVVPDFVVQMGDPESKTLSPAEFDSKDIGSHGSGENVPLEATLKHVKGGVGLARASAPDTGDSQFYFNLKDLPQLDNQYCVFGKIIKGVELMDKLQVGDTIKSIRVVAAKPKADTKTKKESKKAVEESKPK